MWERAGPSPAKQVKIEIRPTDVLKKRRFHLIQFYMMENAERIELG